MTKISKAEAKKIATRAGINFNADYHTLRSSQVDFLEGLRKRVGYRKPASASGSTARYFFYYLKKA